MALVRRAAQSMQISAEVQRKLIHVGTGLYAILLPWLFPDRWPVYVLIGVTLVVMLVLRLPNSRLGRRSTGSSGNPTVTCCSPSLWVCACFWRETICIFMSCQSPS
jgi:hypothetical protein